MTYFYRDESAKIPYSVKVQPGPTADSATATLHKGRAEGPVVKTEQLGKQGKGTLPLELAGLELADSPLFVVFLFKSKGHESRTVRALSLAEAVPATCEADPKLADPGETVTLKVTGWAALVHDRANAPPTETPEEDAARISEKTRKAVKWRVAGKDLADQGETVTFQVSDEHKGKVLPVEAYLPSSSEGSEPPGRATAQVDCRLKVKLVLKDAMDAAIANAKCVFNKLGTTEDATSDGEGAVKTLPPKVPCRLQLRVDFPDPTFDVDIPILVGELPPATTLRGQQARLRNLGYYWGELAQLDEDRPDEEEDPFAWKGAVEEFQCDHGLPVTGECDGATQSKLEQEHGS